MHKKSTVLVTEGWSKITCQSLSTKQSLSVFIYKIHIYIIIKPHLGVYDYCWTEMYVKYADLFQYFVINHYGSPIATLHLILRM